MDTIGRLISPRTRIAETVVVTPSPDRTRAMCSDFYYDKMEYDGGPVFDPLKRYDACGIDWSF